MVVCGGTSGPSRGFPYVDKAPEDQSAYFAAIIMPDSEVSLGGFETLVEAPVRHAEFEGVTATRAGSGKRGSASL
eukprot:11209495-Lingulodinium_polyedra.AAC.1